MKLLEDIMVLMSMGSALSNIVKCNDGSTTDNTTDEIRTNCMDKLGVIWKEVEILKPKRIVFFTGRNYDDFIDGHLLGVLALKTLRMTNLIAGGINSFTSKTRQCYVIY